MTLNNFWSLGDSGRCSPCGTSVRLPSSAPASWRTVRDGCWTDPTGLTNELDSQIYTDMQVGWSPQDLFGGGWTFAFGVNNLSDERPPACFSCDLNSLTGRSTRSLASSGT